MGSSEIVDSGRFSGGRSNFSQTCSLLSQYLKENGSFGGLGLGLTQNNSEANKGVPTETMNFLPMIEKSGASKMNAPPALSRQLAAGKDETQKKPTAQMTIFYGGQVIVFNDFPADKAQEIMALATKSSAAQNHPIAAVAPPRANQSLVEPAPSIPNIVPAFGMHEPSLDSDLPIARKNSLARFLEKRRDRITASAPYPKSKPAPAHVAANGEAWLGLTPQLPFQVQRN